MKQTLKLSWVLIALLAAVVVSSCKKDDDKPAKEVTAGFSYTVDANNTLMYTFTNESQNATSYVWDFGDGSTTSTDANPVHTFTAAGTFTVKLTATGDGGSDVITQPVTVVNANEMLTILTGGDQKTWKLIRDVSTGRYPLECGPEANPTEIWWAMGKGNDELANRPCVLNDEWIFKADGSFAFDAKGDYWGETGVFAEDLLNKCNSTDDMRGPNGEDLSAWNNGTHQWSIEEGKLTVSGLGAFIGLQKIGTDLEVKTPQESVSYKITKLSEGSTDTLALETTYDNGNGHWRIVLVHYDNPADEPPLPGPKPNVTFDMAVDGLTITITNNTSGATSYAWDFGDGQTSTEQNPTHTYATPGIYNVKLVASNANGSNEGSKMAFITNQTVSDAVLQGGAWKIRDAATSIFVGPGLGDPSWWQVPYTDMQPNGAWYCIMNDEFIFSEGGVYEYKTNGDARNDGYKGQTAGCYTDAELAAQDFPFLSATHSYVLNTDDPAHPYIILTNGPSQAAFIGFYKGYYGGENNDQSTAPNGGIATNRYEVLGYANSGTKEYLFLTVIINLESNATWSVILER